MNELREEFYKFTEGKNIDNLGYKELRELDNQLVEYTSKLHLTLDAARKSDDFDIDFFTNNIVFDYNELYARSGDLIGKVRYIANQKAAQALFDRKIYIKIRHETRDLEARRKIVSSSLNRSKSILDMQTTVERTPFAMQIIEDNRKKIDNCKKELSAIDKRLNSLNKELSNLKDEIDILTNGGILPQVKESIIETIKTSPILSEEQKPRIDQELTQDKKPETDKDYVQDKNDTANQEQLSETEKVDQEQKPDTNQKEKTENQEQPQEPVLPVVKHNRPKLTWKTALAVAAGIGIGATVFFTAGALGVSIMTVGASIANIFLNRKLKKMAQINRLGGSSPITFTVIPRKGLLGKIDKLKNYLKSEAGLRDMSYLLNSAIITGNALNIASSISKLATAQPSISPESTAITDTGSTSISNPDVIATQTPTSYDNIVLGNKVDGFNVSTGHTNAANAVYDYATTALNQNLVTGDSIFNRFAVINPDGTLGSILDTKGLSISELCAQQGIDASQIAVDVARSDGASQAWISIEELTKGIGGKTL